MASGLLASRIDTTELETMGDLVADALGVDRILTIVSLYDQKSRLLFRNENGTLLFGEAILPLNPEHIDYNQGPHSVRFLNLRLLPTKQYLQVGFLMDKAQFRWSSVKRTATIYVVIIFLILVMASFFLSQLLVRPLRNLSFYLERLTKAIEEGRELPNLPHSFGVVGKGDDFARLAITVRALGEKLQRNFALSQAAAAQMAHELKTPLTVIRNQLERMRLNPQVASNLQLVEGLEEGTLEIEHLSSVISDFLDWASLQSGPKDEVFAVRVGDCAKTLVSQLEKIYPGRISYIEKTSLTVFAREEAVLQAVRNLLENALKYSPAESLVMLTVDARGILVEDKGPGIPAAVLERLGQPFNRGPRIPGVRSIGLGLAWVKLLCDRYGWSLQITRSDDITQVKIMVPEEASA